MINSVLYNAMYNTPKQCCYVIGEGDSKSVHNKYDTYLNLDMEIETQLDASTIRNSSKIQPQSRQILLPEIWKRSVRQMTTPQIILRSVHPVDQVDKYLNYVKYWSP